MSGYLGQVTLTDHDVEQLKSTPNLELHCFVGEEPGNYVIIKWSKE